MPFYRDGVVMTTGPLAATPLTAKAFAPFGQVIAPGEGAGRAINRGAAVRYDDLAAPEVVAGRVGISVFVGDPVTWPVPVPMLERHPLGSQSFLPMGSGQFLVVVAQDAGGIPGRPQAYLAGPGQGVHYPRGLWHGVLMPLDGPMDFAVLDRIGPGDNLEEHWFDAPLMIVGPF
ncbi:MAG: ureidoglycolate lyase [Pseudomonadota bacterium]